MKLEEATKYATDLLFTLPKKSTVRVIGHTDADGISAAAIVAIALARAGYKFHVSIERTEPDLVEKIKKEENEMLIFVDIGSSYLEQMDKIGCNVIVLDHHLGEGKEIPKNVMYVNARLYGIDGSREACGASIAYAFAMAMDENNVDLSQLAIAGIIGDKQVFEGFNRKILEDGIGSGYVEEREEYILSGKSLKEVLESSLEPYFTGFKNASPFLEKLGIDENEKFENLKEEERKKLLSALTLKLLEQGCDDVGWKRITYYGKKYGNLYDLSSKLNACARLNESGTGISLCFGDMMAWENAEIIQERYRDEIRKEMRELEEMEPKERENFTYFHVNHPPLSGVLAGLSLKYLPQFNKKKPVIALAKKDNFIDISGRATDVMVKEGVNLGEAIKKAAESVGGIGGGHPVAAGGKIPADREKEFLENLDRAMKR